ncbi:hypothetical protein TREMEDRAFT_74973 [Tremella mesenterica DSM 1558]|uniref:uncharacterized protein n=1 Tax=Tremella mesenterica (strain ATCC 24925 / CBS 8224 / DSM 1558 / NBRC 9311 / NRRL Y-6157 / RJB 2259-6 / UBC 559-6) TaxID=578456 RepID=UPI00032BB86B|nr:uncharacterized protein TREMEDRAFT_74973 [Tremella mesenterica DSM 1558]EIW65659.1 hypothetical protein TREMEDRAFT_74973 [Tremella mesenterica DSM 1558]
MLWHTISPSTRPLSLSLLELTPLALTLSLTLAPPPPPPVNPQGKKKRRRRRPFPLLPGESDPDTAVENDDDDSYHLPQPVPGSWPTDVLHGESFKDLLSHGVVVAVNGQPWSRIVAHVGDSEDEEDHDEHQGQEEEWEEGEWVGQRNEHGEGMEEGLGGSGVHRRRPRRARFVVSGARPGDGGEERRKRRGTGIRQGNDRDKDRAIVVVYGLTPGKEYEIELRVVGMESEDTQAVSNTVVIPPSPLSNPLHLTSNSRSRANSLRSRSNTRSRSNSLNTPSTQPHTPTPAPLHTIPNFLATDSPSPPEVSTPIPVLSPVDAQVAHLRQALAAAHAEKEHLHVSLKEARRANQRADAALRMEVDTIRRAIEKASALDMRSKQKVLALQEQVKQGWAGAETAEKESQMVESGMTQLKERLSSAELDLAEVRKQWETVRIHEESVRESDRKARAEEDKRLQEVVGRVEKLKAKKEKKELESVELEKKTDEIERQREEVERKIEEDRQRRIQAYWPRWEEYTNVPTAEYTLQSNRSLTTHSSMSNLHVQPRGVIHPIRHLSASATSAAAIQRSNVGPGVGVGVGSGGTPTNQLSPTFSNTIYPSQPSPTSIGSFRTTSVAPGQTSNTSTSNSLTSSTHTHGRTTPGTGVNVTAPPFQPGTNYEQQHHTTLMPLQLQHRIYLPSGSSSNLLKKDVVHPTPQPTFRPPPSVVEQQQQQQQQQQQLVNSQKSSPTILSTPNFPPLSSHPHHSHSTPSPHAAHGSLSLPSYPSHTSLSLSNTQNVPGPVPPSLASIVTRAVLSPTSSLVGITSSPTISKSSPISTRTASTTPMVKPTQMKGHSPILPSHSHLSQSSQSSLTTSHGAHMDRSQGNVHDRTAKVYGPNVSHHQTHNEVQNSTHHKGHGQERGQGAMVDGDFPPLSPTSWSNPGEKSRSGTPPVRNVRKGTS